jgi:hypothetical protein
MSGRLAPPLRDLVRMTVLPGPGQGLDPPTDAPPGSRPPRPTPARLSRWGARTLAALLAKP